MEFPAVLRVFLTQCLVAKIDSHRLAEMFAFQLPSPKLSLKMPSKLPLHHIGKMLRCATSRLLLTCATGEFWGAFPPKKGKPCAFQNPLSENPLGGAFFLFQNCPAVRVIGWQVTGKNCLAAILGGHFGPEKKYLGRPPQNSPQTPSRPLPPPSPLVGEPPPPLVFSIKTDPRPFLAPRTPPSPPPSRKK